MKYANAFDECFYGGIQAVDSVCNGNVTSSGCGFNTRFVPMNRSNDELVIDQGPLITTGRKLDIYCKGGTLLGRAPMVRWFTCRGDLLVDQSGFSTANGHVVLGDGGGPITVPVGVELAITNDGTVTATDPVQPDAPPLLLGTCCCVIRQDPHSASHRWSLRTARPTW